MSRRPLALLAALAVWLAAAPGPARAAPSPDPKVVAASERELEAGLAAYGQADYARAIESFERAYALHPSPQYLYAWAQAARSMGDCTAAIELYRRFIAAGATGASLQAARQNEARCADELAARAETDDVAAAPEPTPSPAAPAPVVADVPAEPESPRPRPDGLGLALVVTGGVALGAGSALLAVASARRATQAEQTEYERFDALDQQILRLDVAGGITLGAGAALAIAGAIRLATRSRRERAEPRQAFVIPTLDARGTPMILLQITPRRLAPGHGGRSFDRHE